MPICYFKMTVNSSLSALIIPVYIGKCCFVAVQFPIPVTHYPMSLLDPVRSCWIFLDGLRIGSCVDSEQEEIEHSILMLERAGPPSQLYQSQRSFNLARSFSRCVDLKTNSSSGFRWISSRKTASQRFHLA